MIRCLHCGAETSNGLALCELCQRKAGLDLEFIPVYFRNLARWRPGRAGSRPVPGSRVLYEGPPRDDTSGDRISDRLDAASNMLTTWARAFANDRHLRFIRPLTFTDAALVGELEDGSPLTSGLCAAFEHYLVSISTLDWCGEFVRDLARHEAMLRGLTETTIPGWYAGCCRRCGAATYVVPGLTWVTCGACGVTTYARDHLDTILDEARGWVARPKRVAEAMVALVDTEESVPKLCTRIRQWAFQGDLTPVYRTERDYVWSDELRRLVVAKVDAGYARYRFGEVLDLALVGAPRVVVSSRVS